MEGVIICIQKIDEAVPMGVQMHMQMALHSRVSQKEFKHGLVWGLVLMQMTPLPFVPKCLRRLKFWDCIVGTIEITFVQLRHKANFLHS